MTLIPSKNGKADTRMIEFYQSVNRLGLDKAAAQAELDRMHSDIAEVGTRRAVLLNDIEDAEKRLQIIRQEIMDAVNAGRKDIAAVSSTRQEADKATGEKKKKLVQLEGYIVSLNSKVNVQQEALFSIEDKVKKEREILSETKGGIHDALAEKRLLEADIVALQELKSELKEAVAASEKMMTYLAEKEQFLNRKEADLIKYEKRVEKMREDAGNKIKMKFK